MSIHTIQFQIADPQVACRIEDTTHGGTYDHGSDYTTPDFSRPEFQHITHVAFVFSSPDPTVRLRHLASADSCVWVDGSSAAGNIVWALLEIPAAQDCRFDWAFGPELPPCTINITIKKS